MTCLIGEVLDGPVMKSHTSMLEMFFVYTLALCTPIFKKKSPLKRLGKSSKLFIVVTFQGRFFLENWHIRAIRYIRKTSLTQKYVTSSLARPDLRLSSKSLQCFTYRVVTFMQPCVYNFPILSVIRSDVVFLNYHYQIFQYCDSNSEKLGYFFLTKVQTSSKALYSILSSMNWNNINHLLCQNF